MKSFSNISNKKLKIGINATSISSRPSGAKIRFLGLYPKLFSSLKKSHFTIYHSKDYEISMDIKQTDNVSFRKTPFISDKILARNIRGLFFWKNEIKSQKFDIFENLNLPTIHNKHGITIQTIHDVRHLNENGLLLNFYKFIYKKSSEYSDAILTVSETMKTEIINKLPDSNVSVIYNGLNFSAPHLRVCSSKRPLKDNYILSVGHFEKRKNYINLVLAFHRLVEKGFSDNLVIVGNDSGTKKAVNAIISELKLSKRVFLFSNIGSEMLAALYQHAKLFIFPSKYEGFGIPIIEAFHYRCPVILSDTSVFREITEDKLIYFNPNNILKISSAIEKMLTSKDLQLQSINYGIKRAQDFDNKRLAKMLINEYVGLLSQKNKAE